MFDDRRLSNPEIEHHGYQDIDWLAREASRLESPLAGGDDGLFVQSAGIERTNDPNVGGTTVAPDDEFKNDRSLNLLSQGIVRVRRPDLSNYTGCSHRAAKTVHAAAGPAARSGADARPTPRSDTGPDALADAAARTGPGRRSVRNSAHRESYFVNVARGERLGVEENLRQNCRVRSGSGCRSWLQNPQRDRIGPDTLRVSDGPWLTVSTSTSASGCVRVSRNEHELPNPIAVEDSHRPNGGSRR